MSNWLNSDADLYEPGHVYSSRCFNGTYPGANLAVGTTITLYQPQSQPGPSSGHIFFVSPEAPGQGAQVVQTVAFTLTQGHGTAFECPGGWTCAEIDWTGSKLSVAVHEHPA